MSFIVRRIVLSIVGLVLTLAWWTLTGHHDSTKAPPAVKVPAVLWSGIEGPLAIETNLASPGRISIDFEEKKAGGETGRTLRAEEALPVGPHRFEIRCPPHVGASIEVTVDHAKVGEHLFFALSGGGVKTYQFDEPAGELRAGAKDDSYSEGFDLEDCATADRERLEALYREMPQLKNW